MDISLLTILGIGFILGIKHAIEPDHIIAVSTIASRSKKLRWSSLAGVFWGIGHTATLLIVGIVLILSKNSISEKWAGSLEFVVGIMLVYLGFSSLLAYRKKAEHIHKQHVHRSYLKSMCIGLVHGLAGSAAMVLLTMSTVQTVWEGAFYILCFGLGTIIGMLFFTTILGIPFVMSTNNMKLNHSLTRITGLISILFGLYYMYNLGFSEGLFALWIE